MAWIESHQQLARHPKAKRLARLLGVGLPATIGHLHLLWWWATDFAEDGDLTPYDADEIADAALWEGKPAEFLRALIDAGFVDEPAGALDGSVVLHDWADYAGKLIERREYDRERKREWRERQKGKQAPTPRPAPAELVEDDGFEVAWAPYPRKIAKAAAHRAYGARLKGGDTAAAMQAAAGHYRQWCIANNVEPQYILHGATFYGPDRRFAEWVDGPPAGAGAKGSGGPTAGLSAAAIAGYFDDEECA
jgi:hypothetical protein